MKRVFLLIVTNLAVMLVLGVVLSIAMQFFGIQGTLDRNGNLDLKALLLISAIIGFVGSFISLAMSKWTAKRMTGAQVIEQPRNADEAWLFNTVQTSSVLLNVRTSPVGVWRRRIRVRKFPSQSNQLSTTSIRRPQPSG